MQKKQVTSNALLVDLRELLDSGQISLEEAMRALAQDLFGVEPLLDIYNSTGPLTDIIVHHDKSDFQIIVTIPNSSEQPAGTVLVPTSSNDFPKGKSFKVVQNEELFELVPLRKPLLPFLPVAPMSSPPRDVPMHGLVSVLPFVAAILDNNFLHSVPWLTTSRTVYALRVTTNRRPTIFNSDRPMTPSIKYKDFDLPTLVIPGPINKESNLGLFIGR